MTQRYGQYAENPSRCAPVVPSTCRPSDWTVLLFLDGRRENSAGQKVRLLHLGGTGAVMDPPSVLACGERRLRQCDGRRRPPAQPWGSA